MSTNHSLSIILPAYNEEDNIQKTIEECLDFLSQQNFFADYELIVINDGSTDQTANILDRLKDSKMFRVVTHLDNLGYGEAMASGVKQAKYSWLLLMDSDGQFKIGSLNEVSDYLSEYDIIAGYRHRRADTLYRRILGKFYTFLARRLFGLTLRDINCGFKLFKKEALHLNGTHYHAGVFYTDIFIRAKQNGHRIKEVPIEHYSRVRGKQTGANFNVMLNTVVDLVNLIFTKR